MKGTVILSFLMLLVSCREVVKETPEIKTTYIARSTVLEHRIDGLDRELQRFKKDGMSDDHPMMIKLTAHLDSLKATLP